MTRWDSPLFTVLYDDETPPFDAIWEALIGSDGNTKTIKPHQATVLVGDMLQISYLLHVVIDFFRNLPQNRITFMS